MNYEVLSNMKLSAKKSYNQLSKQNKIMVSITVTELT